MAKTVDAIPITQPKPNYQKVSDAAKCCYIYIFIHQKVAVTANKKEKIINNNNNYYYDNYITKEPKQHLIVVKNIKTDMMQPATHTHNTNSTGTLYSSAVLTKLRHGIMKPNKNIAFHSRLCSANCEDMILSWTRTALTLLSMQFPCGAFQIWNMLPSHLKDRNIRQE